MDPRPIRRPLLRLDLGRLWTWDSRPRRCRNQCGGVALATAELGFAAELRGDAEQALTWHTRSLTAATATGDPRAVALAEEGLAGAHSLAGNHYRAETLLEAATTRRAAIGAPLPAAERVDVDRITARLKAHEATE